MRRARKTREQLAEPTPEEIAEACRLIREAGYVDMQGVPHPPWSDEEYLARAGITPNSEPRVTSLRAVLGVQPSTQISADDWYYHLRDGTAHAQRAIAVWARRSKRTNARSADQ